MKRTKSMIYKETAESRELSLFAENSRRLWDCSITPVIENLKKKVVKGVYDSEKAIEAFYYVMTTAAKLYGKEYGGADCFSVTDRWTAATDMRDFVEAEYLNN